MMRYLPIILLSSCTSFFPPKVVEVNIPVAVPCITEMPTKPEFISNEDLLKLKDGNFVYALHVDRLKRMGYEENLEALMTGCIK